MTNSFRLDDLIDDIRRQHADPLDQLSGAVDAASHLGEIADHLVGHFVDQARRSGASWTAIGQSIGTSKQAAQKRFVPKEPAGGSGEGFDRFTDRARQAVIDAQAQARGAGNQEITAEHLLLGLLRDRDNSAATTLAAQGVDLETLRAAAEDALPRAAEEAPPELIPFDSRAKKALELTFRQSLRLGHHEVGTEHVLLALLEVEDGEGVLSRFGVTRSRLEQRLPG
ncbi:Clp protease N-terminal domain-containing protein [Saccharopolyspora griseoalba]|uniref:Clp protease N-terminal domain-containing protein n=1 Tax=Saccharopolyspora griseoalba TaxID=1431848 RepID=A0ABW2LQV4_9PSEU